MEADCSFPLKDISSVVEVFKAELTKAEPNLAKLSIVLGFFETALTCKGSSNSCPSLDKETYDALVAKFQALIQKNLSANKQQRPATREFITDVADLVWSCLSKSYFKDKPHIQNLYSFLTGKLSAEYVICIIDFYQRSSVLKLGKGQYGAVLFLSLPIFNVLIWYKM